MARLAAEMPVRSWRRASRGLVGPAGRCSHQTRRGSTEHDNLRCLIQEQEEQGIMPVFFKDAN